MDWLGNRDVGAYIERWCDAHAATPHTGQIAQNIAKQIGRDDDIELLRFAGQQHGSGVHQHLVDFDVGESCGLTAHGIPEGAVGQRQDVGLMDDGQLLAGAGVAEFEGDFADTGRSCFGDDALGHGLIPTLILALDVESLGVFADDEQIDTR